MPQIHELSAAELARQIRQRTITPVEVAQSFLERMDALEPQLEAWVRVDRETVLADAQQRQEELESGAATGPLHGVPIGIKDIYHIAGIPTTAGSKVYADYVPDETAVTIDLLRNAGAVILGKTVTTEFACLDPSHTKNPWNPAHTPGGSSSGSAVSVAVRMCPVAMGSQTIGSVLRPASYNGVTGFKPTYGRVSRRGVVPVSWSLDTVGWMGRTVEDMALLLQVMAGPDEQDPVASRLPAGDYLSDLESSGPPRIGLITSFFMEESDQETQKQTRAVLERLSSAGASVVELTLPESFNTAFQDQMIIMGAEAAA
ncbi:MAG: amidase, partial [Chloroflexi bacterium]|nr:amidase [Chloroflexota bacterium]